MGRGAVLEELNRPLALETRKRAEIQRGKRRKGEGVGGGEGAATMRWREVWAVLSLGIPCRQRCFLEKGIVNEDTSAASKIK